MDVQNRTGFMQNISNNFEIFKNMTNIVYAIVIACTLVIIITSSINNKNALIGLITSYGAILASLLLLLGWIFKYTLSSSYYSKLLLLTPFILLIIIISLILAYLSVYFNRITSNKISKYYYLFSNLSGLFLIIQMFIILSSVTNIDFAATKTFSSKTFTLLMFIATLNTIWVISLGVILKYYSTDG